MLNHPDYEKRRESLMQVMRSAKIGCIAVIPGPTLFYLTGLHFHLMERPTIMFFSTDSDPVIALPELESLKLDNFTYPVKPFTYGENPDTWAGVVHDAVTYLGKVERIGVESTSMRFLEMNLIQNDAQIAFSPADNLIATLRIVKDEDEITAMRKAVEIAEGALIATLPIIKAGISERDLAAELVLNLFRGGSDPEIPFSPIVSFGENTANPHAHPSARRLNAGDLVLIDWGANYTGYFSDLTRTFAYGALSSELVRIAEIVKDANQAANKAVRPGATASEIDDSARSIIENNHYGEFFTHRTGHGLGLEAHEHPYIRNDNNLQLTPGMCFTIEPGIYLPGKGGVRIEDNVVVTTDNCETLSNLPRDLIVLE